MKTSPDTTRRATGLRIATRGLSLVLVAGAMAAAMAVPAQSQQKLWNIYVNWHSTPPTVGVAPLNWSANGWQKNAGPYYSQRAAWDVVCRMAASNRYRSPDIEQGRVGC